VALRAGGEDALPFSEDVLAKVSTVPITTAILRRAGALLPPTLPSLDAIHLATAISLEAVAEFVCYDGQLTQAAAANGLTVGSPS
jgi:predicted nucleic acid-binding protein